MKFQHELRFYDTYEAWGGDTWKQLKYSVTTQEEYALKNYTAESQVCIWKLKYAWHQPKRDVQRMED